MEKCLCLLQTGLKTMNSPTMHTTKDCCYRPQCITTTGTTITKPGFWATTPVSDGPNWAKSLAAAFLAAVVDDATAAASQDARVGYCIPLLCRATSSNRATLRPLLACEPSYEPPTSARLMVYTKRSLLARNCRSLAKTCHFKARISHFSLHLLLSHIG